MIEGVGVNPTRTGLLEMLALMGADLRLVNHRSAGAEPVADIEVRPAQLRGVRVPERLVPLAIDEFPAFFIAAACAEGETLVTGAEELRVKESDRIAVMARGLDAVGVRNEVLPDGLRIEGGPIGGGVVDSHGDHRVAMSFAVASLRASAPIEILDMANVATSFPGFADLARSAGLPARRGDGLLSVPATGDTQETVPSGAPVIAIDGPSGSGKGTIARLLAGRLGWHLLDSGASYRLTALAGAARGLDPADEPGHAAVAGTPGRPLRGGPGHGGERVLLDGRDVTRELRAEVDRQHGLGRGRHARRAGRAARAPAGVRASRRAWWPTAATWARWFSRPPALKVFLTASPEERARRRYNQLKEKGLAANLAGLSQEILERDRRDSARSVAPLRPAADAVVIDSTGMTVDDVVNRILALAHEALSPRSEFAVDTSPRERWGVFV